MASWLILFAIVCSISGFRVWWRYRGDWWRKPTIYASLPLKQALRRLGENGERDLDRIVEMLRQRRQDRYDLIARHIPDNLNFALYVRFWPTALDMAVSHWPEPRRWQNRLRHWFWKQRGIYALPYSIDGSPEEMCSAARFDTMLRLRPTTFVHNGIRHNIPSGSADSFFYNPKYEMAAALDPAKIELAIPTLALLIDTPFRNLSEREQQRFAADLRYTLNLEVERAWRDTPFTLDDSAPYQGLRHAVR